MFYAKQIALFIALLFLHSGTDVGFGVVEAASAGNAANATTYSASSAAGVSKVGGVAHTGESKTGGRFDVFDIFESPDLSDKIDTRNAPDVTNDSGPSSSSSGAPVVFGTPGAAMLSGRIGGSKKRSGHYSRKTTARQMDEVVRSHFTRATLREVLNDLIPGNWQVQFDMSAELLDRHIVFHAETTRHRALDDLLSGLGLKGVLYPEAGVLFIHKIR